VDAKRNGHANEEKIVKRLQEDEEFARSIGRRIFGRDVGRPVEVSGGGAAAERVTDIFGHRTSGKPDVYVQWRACTPVKFSVKMSVSGQVFLTSVDRFLSGYSYHFKEVVPDPVVQMLQLFIGTDQTKCDLVMKGREYLGPKQRRSDVLQEVHQGRLLGITLDRYFPNEWLSTLQWLDSKAGRIADFSFSRGFAGNQEDFATHVWYCNLIQPRKNVDKMFSVASIIEHANQAKVRPGVGPRNGGSTILFPFGFLQMKSYENTANQMQFHQQLSRLSQIKSL